MLLDTLGRVIKPGQKMVFPSDLLGCDKMIQAEVVEVTSTSVLEPNKPPQKILVVAAVIRIPIPMQLSQLPAYIVEEAKEEAELVKP